MRKKKKHTYQNIQEYYMIYCYTEGDECPWFKYVRCICVSR